MQENESCAIPKATETKIVFKVDEDNHRKISLYVSYKMFGEDKRKGKRIVIETDDDEIMAIHAIRKAIDEIQKSIRGTIFFDDIIL